ncbi:MAG TPA: hypothetical protein PKD90_11795 [Phnomibacter sp.]|nr:hypothetical protein [Phnomibacter sp.]
MAKYIKALVIMVLLTSFQEPAKLTWKIMEAIEFEEKYNKDVAGKMLFPKWPPHIKKLEGQRVTVSGYVIPMDNKGEIIALSANPYDACFFCGKAGPASIMAVELEKKNNKYVVDEYVSFTGWLKLNDSDINQFYYILEHAVPVKK